MVVLEISTWAGISLGGTHYYGELMCVRNGKLTKVELTYKLSATQAHRLSKGDHGYRYRAGQKTGRFETRQEVIDRALEVWKDHFPNENVLVLGRFATMSPKPVLDGPPDVMREANEIYKLYEPIADKDHEALDPIKDKLGDLWIAIINGNGRTK